MVLIAEKRKGSLCWAAENGWCLGPRGQPGLAGATWELASVSLLGCSERSLLLWPEM